jgi:uncharacterized protein (TIGR02444 family)
MQALPFSAKARLHAAKHPCCELQSGQRMDRVRDETNELVTDTVALYGRDGVANACLLLQQRTSLDVNVLLMAAWMGARRKRALGAAEAARARALVADWHAQIVTPLRAIRRRLKSGPPPAPSEQTDLLRAKIQAIEISAEIIELSQLQGLADEMTRDTPVNDKEPNTVNNMLHVVELFAGRPADAEEIAAVNVIATQAMEHFS